MPSKSPQNSIRLQGPLIASSRGPPSFPQASISAIERENLQSPLSRNIQFLDRESLLFFHLTFHKFEITLQFKNAGETNSLFSYGVRVIHGNCWLVAAKEISDVRKPFVCLGKILQVGCILAPLDYRSQSQICRPRSSFCFSFTSN